MKYEIIDHVARFVKRTGLVQDPHTMMVAKEEAPAYDFRRISEGYYACIHGAKMYVIIEKGEMLGCSCDDMTYKRTDGTACKHLIAFTKLATPVPVDATLDSLDAEHLRNVAGWCGTDETMHPSSLRIPPDPDMDLGVGDPLPEPKPVCTNCKVKYTKPKTKQKADKTMKPEPKRTEVQTTEPQQGFLTAAVTLDEAIAAFDLYGQAKTRLLSDSDILYIGANGKPVRQDIEGAVPYIKKSGWHKMARFFGLSVDIIGREKIWTEDAKGNKYYLWTYQIKVSHQCGAYVISEGVCSSRDKFFTKGSKIEADEKNVMLKAQTVGINRGISDLLGAGEVSAEEMI